MYKRPLSACYAADVVVTAFADSALARELDALEKVADSMPAVSDAMTEPVSYTHRIAAAEKACAEAGVKALTGKIATGDLFVGCLLYTSWRA